MTALQKTFGFMFACALIGAGAGMIFIGAYCVYQGIGLMIEMIAK